MLFFLFFISHAVAAAAVNNTDLSECRTTEVPKGQCITYPPDGPCAQYIYASNPNGSIYLPDGWLLNDLNRLVIEQVEAIATNRQALGEECYALGQPFSCFSVFATCRNSTSRPGVEDIPILPCAHFCGKYWNTCENAFSLFYTQVLRGNYEDSTIPNCPSSQDPHTLETYLGSFDPAWNGNPQPQPADRFGQARKLPFQMPDIRGLAGVHRFPVGAYNYTFNDSTTELATCFTPNTSNLTEISSADVICPLPLERLGDRCVIQCPLTLTSPDQVTQIQLAFIVPASLGLFLCVFVLGDSVWSIIHNARTNSTMYALIGSVLGILYFLIGPLPTLLYSSSISCSAHLDLVSLSAGNFPPTPPACNVQRASPFVLQLLFNLILFSIVRVWSATDTSFRRGNKTASIGLVLYCVGVPLLCLVIAFSLDTYSSNVAIASAQMARQAVICQLRLSVEAEVLLVFLPFITTGVAIAYIAFVVTRRLKNIQRIVSGVKSRNDNDRKFHNLITRLIVLGLFTFAILIILIILTTVYLLGLGEFGPYYADYVDCAFKGMVAANHSVTQE